jgi:hypothetical protein
MFDALVVGDFTCDLTGATVALVAKAAFVNRETGHTHGWTRQTSWSPATLSKLAELRTLMEIDLGRTHLIDGGEDVSGSQFVRPQPSQGDADGDGEGGLGAHLATPA